MVRVIKAKALSKKFHYKLYCSQGQNRDLIGDSKGFKARTPYVFVCCG